MPLLKRRNKTGSNNKKAVAKEDTKLKTMIDQQPTTIPSPPQKADPGTMKRSLTASTDPISDDETDNEHDSTAATNKTVVPTTNNNTQDQPNLASFDVLESCVVEQGNGKPCTPDKVYRGTTRLETLKFQISQNLVNLKRHVVTTKKMGFAFVTVSQEELVLGTFDASPQPVHVTLPPQQVPSTALAKGKYRIQIKYTAENNPTTLREEVVEFSIV